MPNVLIRHVPKNILEDCKQLASSHNRTLQRELQLILEEAVRFRRGEWIRESSKIRERLKRSRKRYSDSAKLLSEDRQR